MDERDGVMWLMISLLFMAGVLCSIVVGYYWAYADIQEKLCKDGKYDFCMRTDKPTYKLILEETK